MARSDAAAIVAERPHQAEARRPVVLVDTEVTRGRERRIGAGVRHVIQVIPETVENLDVGRQPPVVLHEEAVDVRAVFEIGLAEVLREGRVAEAIGAVDRRLIRGHVREGVGLRRRASPVIGDVLEIDAELVGVVAADVGQVVGHLEHVLREREAGIGVTGNRTAEVGDVGDGDRRTGAASCAGHASLRARRVLHAQLVEQRWRHRRDQLHAGRVLPIREVGPALHRVQPAADVVVDEVVEKDVARRQPVALVDLMIELADRELGVEGRRHVGRLGESEGRLVRRRDRDDARARQVALGVLVAAEEVRLVAQHRTAEVEREDVHVGRRLAIGGVRPLREEREGRIGTPLQAIAALPLQRVRARRRDRVVDHPHRLAELGCVAGGDDLDLADHHFRHRHLPQADAILLRIVAAVDLVVDTHERAVGRDARHPELGVAEAGDAGLEHGEVVGIARRQRQRLDLRLGQHPALFDPAEIDDRRIGGDGNRLAERADVQLDVHDRGAPGRQDDPGLLELAEALQLGGNTIGAEREERRAKQTALVGDDDAVVAGIEVGDGHRDARQDRALVVDDRALNRAVDGLRLRQRRRAQYKRKE